MAKPSGVNPANPAESESSSSSSKAERINGLIEKMEDWTKRDYKDDNLWEAFHDYFDEKSDFELADKDILRDFRTFLRA